MGVGVAIGRGRGAVLALLCAAQFVSVLDVNAVVVALPSVGRELGFSREGLQWVITSYVLFFAGFLLLAGRLADLYGRRRMFVAGLALFTASSLACGLAGSPLALVAFRAAQGLGAAFVAPAALAIISTTFEDGCERGFAMGVWTAVAAGGGAAGLVLGGLIVEHLGWPWIFFVNVPVGLVSIALAFLLLEEGRGPETSRRLDLPGATTVTAGLVALVYGLTRAERVGLDPTTVATLAFAVVLVAAFVLIERRAEDPLVPPSAFRSRDLVGSSLIAFANTATTSPVAVLAALYVQGVLVYPPSLAGLLGLPFSLSVVAGSFLGSRLLEILGARRTMALGLLGICAASLLSAGISATGGVAYVVSGAALSGLSLGCSAVASTARGASAVGEGERGLASGLLNSSAQVGTALGLAVLFAIAAAVSAAAVAGGGEPTPEALVAGYRAAFTVGAGIAAVGALAAVLLIREKRG